MIDHRILTENDPVELIEGLLVTKMPKNPPHRIATKKTVRALEQAVKSGWYVDSQEPITTADSEPEPDVCIVRGDTSDYPDRHPGPDDVGLVVEVADTTLERDRSLKKRAYARAGIEMYWVLNLADRMLEVYSAPNGDDASPDYQNRIVLTDKQSVTLTLDQHEVGTISVSEFLP